MLMNNWCVNYHNEVRSDTEAVFGGTLWPRSESTRLIRTVMTSTEHSRHEALIHPSTQYVESMLV